MNMMEPRGTPVRNGDRTYSRRGSLAATPGSRVPSGSPASPLVDGRLMAMDGDVVSVGDVVRTRSGQRGVVRFVGTVQGRRGTFCGIELVDECRGAGKNDGSVNGISYFSVSHPQSGLFVPQGSVVKLSEAADAVPASPSPGDSGVDLVSMREDEQVSKLREQLAQAQLGMEHAVQDKDASLAEVSAMLEELQNQIRLLEEGNESLEADNAGLRERLRDRDDKLNTMRHERDAKSAEFQETLRAVERSAEEVASIYEEKLATAMAELARVPAAPEADGAAEKLGHMQAMHADLEKALTIAQKSLRALEQENEQLQQSQRALQDEVKQQHGTIQSLEAQLLQERQRPRKAMEELNGVDAHATERLRQENRSLLQQLHALQARTMAAENKIGPSPRASPRGSSAQNTESRRASMATRAAGGKSPWCEMCNTDEHDILNCEIVFGTTVGGAEVPQERPYEHF